MLINVSEQYPPLLQSLTLSLTLWLYDSVLCVPLRASEAALAQRSAQMEGDVQMVEQREKEMRELEVCVCVRVYVSVTVCV